MTTSSPRKLVSNQTFIHYTLLFILLAAIIYTPFVLTNTSFIWEGDGFHQHYPFFREYLTILRNFLATGDWQAWDWSIGLGADTLITYGYYVVGDPFVYLGLLFPQGAEELAFHLIMFIRLWTVGISFLFYARKMAFEDQSALAGSLLYAFSHYAIYNVVRHPFFIHPLIFFPLLCLGIEKVLRKESGVLFILTVALAALSNFYFFYMLTWMLFLYALLRYPRIIRARDWRTLGKWVSTFLTLYLIGLFISAVIFLPQVYGFLSGSRSVGTPPISLWRYPLHYYGEFLLNILTPGTIFWTVGGFSILGVLSLVFLVKRKNKEPTLLAAFIIIGIFLIFPFFGSLMNGLAGPYNRFTFVLPFYFALALVFFLENRKDLNTKDLQAMRWLLLIFSLIYSGASLWSGEFLFYITPIVLGWLTYWVLYAEKAYSFILSLLVLNLTLNALNFYLPHGKYALSEMLPYGTVDQEYAAVFGGLEENLPANNGYRINVTAQDNHVRNHYAYLNTPGTNSYASLTNGYVVDFAHFIETSQFQIIQPLRNGIDDRRIVNQALGVEYIITNEANAAYIPPDYDVQADLSAGNMLVAQTENHAPLAYVETTGISKAAAETLHPVQRESVLADAVIVEDSSATLTSLSEMPSLNFHPGAWDIPENTVTVTEENHDITFTFDQPERLVGEEVFVYFEGIHYQPLTSQFGEPAESRFRMRVLFNQQEKSFLQSDEYNFSSYFKRDKVLLHLNLVETPQATLRVGFDDPGHYSFERISVVSRPFSKKTAKTEQVLKITDIKNDSLTGTLNTSDSGMLVTSIPYSSGWTITLNGTDVPTEIVNIGFIGIPIEAGTYQVEFHYRTPLLKTGVLLSLLGLLALVAYIIYFKRKK